MMRRKSARNAAKATVEKEKKKPESPARKTRRSRRRKRSASPSSDSEDDVSLEKIAQKLSENVVEPVEEGAKSHTPSDDEVPVQSVWTVTTTEDSNKGEIQKLKICLTRPSHSPEKTSKRRRNKSASHHEDSANGEESLKSARLNDSSSANEEPTNAQEDEKTSEDIDDTCKGKGKSKAKTKSKIEKNPKLLEPGTETQSEISANVQVTPQSPTIDIPVDNENVSTDEVDSGIKTDGDAVAQIDNDVNEPEQEETKGVIDELQTCNESAEIAQNIESITDIIGTASDKAVADETDSNYPTEQASEPVSIEETAAPELVSEEAPEPVLITEEAAAPVLITEAAAPVLITEEAAAPPVLTAEEAAMPVLISEETTAPVLMSEEMAEPDSISEEIAVPVLISEETSVPVLPEETEALSPLSRRERDAPILIEEPDASKVSITNEETEAPVLTEEIDAQVLLEETVQPASSETIDELVSSEIADEPVSNEASDEPALSEETVASRIIMDECNKLENNINESAPECEVEQVEEEAPSDCQAFALPRECETDGGEIAVESSEITLTAQEDSRLSDLEQRPAGEEQEMMEVDESQTESLLQLQKEIVEESDDQKNNEDSVDRGDFKRAKPAERKRKWTNTSVFDKLISNLLSINTDTVKAFCPNIEFLRESEIRLDSVPPKERKRLLSAEQSEKRTERKVSVDYKAAAATRNETSEDSPKAEDPEPEDNSNIIALNRKISIVDDTASKLRPPPSPAKNPVSSILYITNLVRPFTLKQLKELLERTGKITENGFWTDRIKSKCYVRYETVEEAESTRNAIHGVFWPIGNGKKLIIDYGTEEEMEIARNPPPPAPVVVPEVKVQEKENEEPQNKLVEEPKPPIREKEREMRRAEAPVREWDVGKEDFHRERERSRSREKGKHRRIRHSRSPGEDYIARKQRKMEESVPQKLMDDLFQKTKTMPSIYWQPLTPDQIATKQQQRLLRMAEHKRRMEENIRSRGAGGGGDFGRGGIYRRRYD